MTKGNGDESSARRWWGTGIALVAIAALVASMGNSRSSTKPQPFVAEALFSDTTPQFVSPAEPKIGESFSIRLRAGKNQVKSAVLNFAGKDYPMQKMRSDALFDYYSAVVPGQSEMQLYYFHVTPYQGKDVYLGTNGAGAFRPAMSNQFSVYPGFKTPDWAKGAVFYQIFPDRFYNGDKSNDVVTGEYNYMGAPSVHVSDWSKLPGRDESGNDDRTREFYGGDLQGIIDKLGYLKGLGIQAIYLNPIFVSPSNHKYDTQDYNHVDPHLGKIVHDGGHLVDPGSGDDNSSATKYIMRTEDPANLQASDKVLQDLIEKAHQMGIRVVLDGVFNHSGNFNKWFDEAHIYPDTAPDGPGAYESKQSPFHNFYTFNSDHWPNNSNYDAWNGYSTLPKLNYQGSAELVKKIQGIGQKWVSPPYNADGWRLDAAGDLGYGANYNLKFWDAFRTKVKAANPNALILAEYYQDPSLYFDGKGWDSIQNYSAFLSPVSLFFTGVSEHSDNVNETAKGNVSEFLSAMQQAMSSFPYQALYTAMNALDNHDVSRFLTRTNGEVGGVDMGSAQEDADKGVKPNVLMQAVTFDMTWPGAPTVYYGDEAGLTGWTDPDDRRTFPWGHENPTLESFYKNIIHVHTETSCFKTGSLVVFHPNQNGVLAYGRFDDKTAALTVINVGQTSQTVPLPAWQLGTVDGTLWQVRAQVGGYQQKFVQQHGGGLTVTVRAGGAVVLTTSLQ
jgi:alpha-glucosidase